MDKESILRQAAEAAQQAQHPNVVQPQPVPMSIQLSTIDTHEGKKLLCMSFFTPTGQAVYFLDPDGATSFAERLIETARVARTGLEIARGSLS